MSMIKTSDLWSEIIEVARENPDHIYDRGPGGDKNCVYQRERKPSCIVGHALHRLGLPIHDLEEFDLHEDSGIGEIIDVHEDLFDVDDVEAVGYIVITQNHQDTGWTWGDAVGRSFINKLQEEKA